MKKRVKLFIAIILIGIFVGLFFIPLKQAFVFTETRSTSPTLFYIPKSKDVEFQIYYVHSIFLSDVLETYRVIDDGNIKMVSMEYEDVGIGLPGYAEEGEALVFEDGKYTLTYEKRSIPSFTIHIGDVDVPLAFLYRGEKYDLKEQLSRGNSYTFAVKRISLFQLWKGVEMHAKG